MLTAIEMRKRTCDTVESKMYKLKMEYPKAILALEEILMKSAAEGKMYVNINIKDTTFQLLEAISEKYFSENISLFLELQGYRLKYFSPEKRIWIDWYPEEIRVKLGSIYERRKEFD